MMTRTVALLLSGAVSVAFSLAAFAEPTPAPAPAPAAATPASAAEDNSIAEIVVTAEKRNESLETVPVAISAYTSKTRDLIGIDTIQDMTNFTPGLAYSTSLDRAFIRGVGRETNNLSTNPGVATYSDGVYNSSVVAASGDELFEDRIEILRGPQGTLYGRNAIAGTINSIAKRPTQDWTAEVRVKVGNYGTHDFEGVVSGPISDTMRVKFGGYRNTQEDGYFRNVLNGQSEGSNLSNGNFFYWEGQLEWDITPDVQFWTKIFQLGYTDAYRVPTNIIGSYDYAAYPAFVSIAGRRLRRRKPCRSAALGHQSDIAYRLLAERSTVRDQSRQQQCLHVLQRQRQHREVEQNLLDHAATNLAYTLGRRFQVLGRLYDVLLQPVQRLRQYGNQFVCVPGHSRNRRLRGTGCRSI